jgi:hypothetical protein
VVCVRVTPCRCTRFEGSTRSERRCPKSATVTR